VAEYSSGKVLGRIKEVVCMTSLCGLMQHDDGGCVLWLGYLVRGAVGDRTALERYYHRIPYFVGYKQAQEELRVVSVQVEERERRLSDLQLRTQEEKATSSKKQTHQSALGKWRLAAAKARSKETKAALDKVVETGWLRCLYPELTSPSRPD